jgi:hypothetical protein
VPGADVDEREDDRDDDQHVADRRRGAEVGEPEGLTDDFQLCLFLMH